MSDHQRWYEERDRHWRGDGDPPRARSGVHDYGRYADEGYRGRDPSGRPYDAPRPESRTAYSALDDDRRYGEVGGERRSFGRDLPDYDAAPYGFGAGYGREGDRGSGRDWWDRTRDEMASWVGDRRAERRREWDHIRGEHRGRGPRNYRRSDERIREDVNDHLTNDASLDASDIEVAVEGGEVTLSGAVSSRSDKRRAEDLAEDVSGVVHVQNNLRPRDATRAPRPEAAEH